MNILLLTNYFIPEIGSGPQLPTELAESLAAMGHNVTVVTGFPRYNVPVVTPASRRRLVTTEKLNGFGILRINTLSWHGSSWIARGLSQLFSPALIGARATVAPRPDLVCTISPPLTMGLAAQAVATYFGVPWVMTVHDLIPQAYIDIGYMESRIAIGVFSAMERIIYKNATALITVSATNRAFVVSRGAAAGRVSIVPNWADTEAIHPASRMNSFRAKHAIGARFVVLYAGTMGYSQDLETVVSAARLLRDTPHVLFLLVGSGVARAKLEQAAVGLENVRFLSMRPKEDYPAVLAAADLCVVALRKEVATPTIPGKIATIMAAGRAILAVLPEGAARRVIKQADCGIFARPGDPKDVAKAIEAVCRDPRRLDELGTNGRRYAEQHLSMARGVALTAELFERIVSSAKGTIPPAH